MVSKRHVHHVLVQLRKVSPWYFVIAIVISTLVSVVSLRQNNVHALQLRDKVLQVDKDNGDVESALRELRQYVYGHMNTQLAVPGGAYPPVQLKYRYDRLVAAQKAQQPSNATLATQAQNYCESQIPTGRSLYRIDCIQNYILTHGAGSSSTIPDSLYKFDFVPPVWSPDLAGISLLITAVLFLALIIRTLFIQWLKYRLHQQSY
jgi:hypothetical protein